ncbi:MAG: hypothetical protein IJ179_10615 [Oscillospiraceae bacterium]|nr:hypothetical protein [Oscillospiraceae bacterium]
MKDCRVTLVVKDNKVNMEGEDISMIELAEMCGALQILTGIRALKLGADIEEVKDNLLDVHLAAMRIVEQKGADT